MEDYLGARRLAEEAGLEFPSMRDDLVIAAQMKRLGISEVYSNGDFDMIHGVQRLF